MKFARRNSLTFPLPTSKSTPKNYGRKNDSHDPDNDDVELNNDLIRKKSIGNPPFPLTGEIDKVLNILNEDNQSVSATSATTASSDDDEVVRISEHAKAAAAISTPVPGRKPLQIPAAKRKEIALLGIEESPTSVSDLVSLSIKEDKTRRSKSKKPISCSAPPSLHEESISSQESSEKSSRRKKVRKPRKKIHFKQTCTMRRTLSRKDMTPKEIRRSWLTAEEYNRMQLRDEILADRIDVGKGKPGTCTRGLESKIEETAMKKLALRMTGIEEVLVEQERQWDEAGDAVHFFYDFSSFAYAYGPVSEEALIHAQSVARQDRIEAEKILSSSATFRGKGAAAFLKRSRFTRRRSWA